MKRLIFLFLFLGTYLLASVATITAIKGDVEVVRNEKSIKAVVGFSLNVKDSVKTIGKSVAQLSFTDDTVVTLGKDSNFNIDDYIFEPKVKKTRFNIAKGVFKSITGKIGKVAPKKFKIKTKTATMGIRGTTILGRVTDDQSTFACTVGAIAVTSNATGEVVRVNAGQITQVGLGESPSIPREFSINELNNLEEDLGILTKEVTKSEEQSIKVSSSVANSEVNTEDIDGDIQVEQLDKNLKEQIIQEEVEKKSKAEQNKQEVEALPDVRSEAFVSDDGLIKWGYWLKGSSDVAHFGANDVRTVWLEGVEASASRIEQLQLTNVNRTYSGQVRGIVAQAGRNDFIDSGNFIMSFDFGAIQPLQDDSYVSFTQGGENWRVNNLVGKIEGNSFSINGFSTSKGSDALIGDGDFRGKFFGSKAQSLGAVFTLHGTVGGVEKIATGTLISQ